MGMYIDTFELIHIYPMIYELLGILPYKDIDGEILYKTRLFVKSTDVCNTKSSKEYEKIIQTQQNIIEKMTERIKELEKYM